MSIISCTAIQAKPLSIEKQTNIALSQNPTFFRLATWIKVKILQINTFQEIYRSSQNSDKFYNVFIHFLVKKQEIQEQWSTLYYYLKQYFIVCIKMKTTERKHYVLTLA